MRKLLIAITLGFLLASCGPSLSAGTVTGKRYEPEDYYYINQCYAYNSKGMCTFSMPVKHVDDEDWYVVIEDVVDGKLVQDSVQVSESMFEACRVGRHYPDCDVPV